MSAITPTTQINALANSIMQNFDANRDGSLSSDEFTTFLTQLIGNVGTPQIPTATTPASMDLSTLFPSASTSAEARTRVGTMTGFDDLKLRDESHNTFKYQIGRILQYFPNTPEGLRQALPEIQKLVPGAKIVGSKGDTIDFGDYDDPKAGRIGSVDVLLAAGEGGRGWAWQPIEKPTAAPVSADVPSAKTLTSSPTPISSPVSGKANASAGSAGGNAVSARG